MKTLRILYIALMVYTNLSGQTTDKIKDDVWQREIQYWKYVEQNEKTNYLTLWHEDFAGYPSTDSLTRKAGIADWIGDLHNKKNKHFGYNLVKKIVNPFGDVIITFYDVVEIWKNDKNEILSKETYKITHTWKKYGDTWLIIGGMSALKKE